MISTTMMTNYISELKQLIGTGEIRELQQTFNKVKRAAKTILADQKRKAGFLVREACQTVAQELIRMFPAVLLEFATGVGKTKPAILAMLKYDRILIVHKQKVHKKNLTQEIFKWVPDFDIDRITFTTYASLHKHIGDWDYILLDECHGITTNNLNYLRQMTTKRLVMLSATVPYKKRLLIISLVSHLFKQRYVRFEVSLIEAINTGILPIPEIVVIDRFLDSTRRDLYYNKVKNKEYGSITVPYQSRHAYPNVNLSIQCSEYEYYQCLCEDMEYWKKRYFREKQEWQEIRWLQFGSKRKRWLSSLKTEIAIALREKVQGKRFVCFTNDIKQCERISGDTIAVHSKRRAKENQKIVDEYNEGIRDELYCVNILNESMNLTSLDCAILVTLSGARIANIQRFGRSTRAEQPVIYIIRIPYTKDDDNYKKFLGELNESFVTYKNINKV